MTVLVKTVINEAISTHITKMSIEKPYQPSDEEMKKAEGMMTKEEKEMSKGREPIFKTEQDYKKVGDRYNYAIDMYKNFYSFLKDLNKETGNVVEFEDVDGNIIKGKYISCDGPTGTLSYYKSSLIPADSYGSYEREKEEFGVNMGHILLYVEGQKIIIDFDKVKNFRLIKSTEIKRVEVEDKEGKKENIAEAILRLTKEKDEISEKIRALNEEGLKLGIEKYGYNVMMWAPKKKIQLGELFRRHSWNIHLQNEVGKFILTDPDGNVTLRPEANMKSFEDIETKLKREIGESYVWIQEKIKEEQLSSGDVVVVTDSFGISNKTFDSVDSELGFIYFTEELSGGGEVKTGIDIRNIQDLKKVPSSDNKFKKIVKSLSNLLFK